MSIGLDVDLSQARRIMKVVLNAHIVLCLSSQVSQAVIEILIIEQIFQVCACDSPMRGDIFLRERSKSFEVFGDYENNPVHDRPSKQSKRVNCSTHSLICKLHVSQLGSEMTHITFLSLVSQFLKTYLLGSYTSWTRTDAYPTPGTR